MKRSANARARDRARDRADAYRRYQARYRAECERTRALPFLTDDQMERYFAALRKAHAALSAAAADVSAAENLAQARLMQKRYEAARRHLLHVQKALGAVDPNATEIAGKAKFEVPTYSGRTR